MKTSELTGALLDYWTGRADGIPASELSIVRHQRGDEMLCVRNGVRYAPSTVWSMGGPIVESEQMNIGPDVRKVDGKASFVWVASQYDGNGEQIGPSLLVAAMRCYVASEFGDEVPDEI